MVTSQTIASLVLFLAQSVPVQSLKLGNHDDIVKRSETIASTLINFYHGNESGHIPGLLPDEAGYYWYQSGAFMSSYIDYWQLTGDDTYNDLVSKGIEWQVGPNDDFMPTNQTKNLGNDDQSIWALGALTAAEYGFPAPSEKQFKWIDLATAVWEDQRRRWDIEVKGKVCDGGLRWQIMTFNNGYNYKQTFANALFFNLGARLARFTGNETYADYAGKTWDWLEVSGLINNETWAVYDGSQSDTDCSKINHIQFSAPSASLAMGAAFMYNYTEGSKEWKERTENLTASTLNFFFPKKEGFKEIACADGGKCSKDLVTYKAFAHRWLAVTTQVASFTADSILPAIRRSAEALGTSTEDNDTMEQTLVTFAAVSNLLIANSTAPRTQDQPAKDKANKTEDDTTSKSNSSSSSTDEGTDKSSAFKLEGSDGFMSISFLVLAFIWIM
ncbi:hypothetical protein NW762_014287 [Fusarium torreyae]|uniref:mannan endo-1,6-alpha-mannosidase n=1 Tax=Fusarium torreyae TaxID=1237075 RepID=A0A9W8RKI0_9HYPO|nr:hypothetical protein NW762_014287 [Fusarium torreyae]